MKIITMVVYIYIVCICIYSVYMCVYCCHIGPVIQPALGSIVERSMALEGYCGGSLPSLLTLAGEE
jgi:hypothetical protein